MRGHRDRAASILAVRSVSFRLGAFRSNRALKVRLPISVALTMSKVAVKPSGAAVANKYAQYLRTIPTCKGRA